MQNSISVIQALASCMVAQQQRECISLVNFSSQDQCTFDLPNTHNTQSYKITQFRKIIVTTEKKHDYPWQISQIAYLTTPKHGVCLVGYISWLSNLIWEKCMG